MAAQAGLCLAWSETPEDTFCRGVAHFYLCLRFVVVGGSVCWRSALEQRTDESFLKSSSDLYFSIKKLFVSTYVLYL